MAEGLVVAQETSADAKCTGQLVPSAVKTVKYLSGQTVTGRYTAVTVLKKEETKAEIPDVQITEVTEEGILRKDEHTHRIAVTAEIQVVEITVNLWIS